MIFAKPWVVIEFYSSTSYDLIAFLVTIEFELQIFWHAIEVATPSMISSPLQDMKHYLHDEFIIPILLAGCGSVEKAWFLHKIADHFKKI